MKAEAAPVSGVAIGVRSCAWLACMLVQRARATRLVARDCETVWSTVVWSRVAWSRVGADRVVFGL